MKKLVLIGLISIICQVSYGQVFLRHLERDTTPVSVMVSDTNGVAQWGGGVLDTMYQKPDSVCFRFIGDAQDNCFEFDTDSQTLAIVRDQDTLRLSISGGNTVAWKDSTRSDQDITQLIDDNMVNVYNSDGTLTGNRKVDLGHKNLLFTDTTTSGEVMVWYINQQGGTISVLSSDNIPTTKSHSILIQDYISALRFADNSTGEENIIGVTSNTAQLTTSHDGIVSGIYVQRPDVTILTGEYAIGSYLDSTSNLFLKLMDSDGTVKYRPVIQPDTFYRANDSIHFTLDDGTHFAVRDSFLTADEVAEIARDSVPEYTFTYDSTLNAILRCTGGGGGTLPDTTWGLSFNGTSSYAEARSLSDLPFPNTLSAGVEFDVLGSNIVFGNARFLSSPSHRKNGYYLRVYSGSVGYSIYNPSGTVSMTIKDTGLSVGVRYEIAYEIDGGDLVLKINGVEVDRKSINITLPSGDGSYKFRIGSDPNGQYWFKGKIYPFQHGTETFPLNEGSGTTITGSEGTILDLHDVTWIVDQITPGLPGGQTCDTIYLTDIHTDSLFRSNDSLFVRLNDGQLFGVPDATVDLSGIRDSIQTNIDSIASHNDRINTNVDSIAAHRTDINQNTTDITTHIANDNDLDPTNELQDITRTGDEIGLTSSGATTTDRNVTAVDHLGDSIRFTMSDGRTFTVRDSSVEESTIRTWIDQGIPDTVLFIDNGSVTAPVEWKDTVTITGSTIYINTGGELKYDSTLNMLTSCRYEIHKSYDTTNYLSFDGANDYLESQNEEDFEFALPQIFDYYHDQTSTYEFSWKNVSYRLGWSTNDQFYIYHGGSIYFLRNATVTSGRHTFKIYDNSGLQMNFDGADLGVAPAIPSFSNNSSNWTFGKNVNYFAGKLYGFTFGNNIFDLSEGSGSTLTSTNSAVTVDINGATWGQDIELTSADTVKVCDTIYLRDIHLDTATYVGDSLYLTLNSGKTYAVEVISGATQYLQHDTTARTTTLTEGGGKFGIKGEQNIKITLDTAGIYTVSADTLYAEDGKSLEFVWNGTQLGVRQEGQPTYQYVDLKGEKGDKGDKGDQGIQGLSLEFNWSGTQLGVRVEGQPTYTYVDLKGEKGDQGIQGIQGEKGDTGKSIEFTWNGTQLGVRQEGDPTYTFTDLKGEKGEKGDPPDTLMYIDDGQLIYAVQAGDTITIDSATLVLADSTGLSYLSGPNQLVYAKFIDGGWDRDTIQLNPDTSIYNQDGTIENVARKVDVNNSSVEWELDKQSGFSIYGPGTPNTRLIVNPYASTSQLRAGLDTLGRLYDAGITADPENAILYSNASGGGGDIKISFVEVDTTGVKIRPNNSKETDFLSGKEYFLKSMDSLNYVKWDTIPIPNMEDIGITTADTTRWGEGGAPQTLSKTGNNVTLSDGGGTVSVADNDNSSTNELQTLSTYQNPTSTSGLVRLSQKTSSGGLKLDGTGGIDVDASFDGNDVVMSIDGSGLAASSPWSGSANHPYVSSSVSSVGIGSSPLSSRRLYINNSQAGDLSFDLDHYVGDNSTMMIATNTRRGGSMQLLGQAYGVDFRINNTGGNVAFRARSDGSVYTTGPIYTDGDDGTSSQVLYGGSDPAWGNLPAQDNYTLSKSSTPSIQFKKNGVLQTDIDFVGTGGIQVNDAFGAIEIDGSGIGSKWTTSGSNIYRNSGVTVGGTTTANNQFRVYDDQRNYSSIDFYNGALPLGSIYTYSNTFYLGGGVDILVESQTGDAIISANNDVNIGGDDMKLNGDNLVYSVGSSFSTNTVIPKSSNYTLPSASGYTNGTKKTILNTSSGTIFISGTGGSNDNWAINSETHRTFVAYGSIWYPNTN